MFDPPAHAGGTDSILEGESNLLISQQFLSLQSKLKNSSRGSTDNPNGQIERRVAYGPGVRNPCKEQRPKHGLTAYEKRY
jgi:hypothetical protein